MKRDLRLAQRYKRDLQSAGNSYEKKQIHNDCRSRLGDGSPSKLISQLGREIDRLGRDASKLDPRLRDIARRGSLEVHAIVIDGSNLVYRDGKLIGLFALRALCAELVDKYSVTVVFDSSTRRRLGLLDDGALRAQLPGPSVHVTAPATSTDKTVLDLAAEPTIFVISNDRFAEYLEKSAIRDGRIIRHEILDARAIVRDIGLDLRYTARLR
ncbi:hypothetical protein [Microbacterium sp. SORGH_AS_0421]|uniref:hypothetical protein n=1 Tax=Microbacterium sp. SORGH_AS_0421 TaxID=3041768 RepID=UPI0027D8C113|nr:hypothetical protein [Microbacterium sp. SORGH_AS_0421]